MRTPFPSLVRVPGSLSRVRTAAGSQAAPGPHTVCAGSPSSPSGTDWQTAKRPCCAARVAAPSAASVPRLGPRRSHSQHRASVPRARPCLAASSACVLGHLTRRLRPGPQWPHPLARRWPRHCARLARPAPPGPLWKVAQDLRGAPSPQGSGPSLPGHRGRRGRRPRPSLCTA